MIVYGAMAAITVFCYLIASLHPRLREKKNSIATVVFFVIYLTLLCLRDYDVGVDTVHYVQLFNNIQFLNWDNLANSGVELGFVYLARIVGIFGDVRFFIVVVSLLTVIPLMVLYIKESEDALLCCSFFFISLLFEMLFSGMRQGIAISLTVPAYFFTKHKQLLPFVATVALATLFHSSGILIALLYPLYHAKITRKWLWFVLPAMIAVYLTRDQLFSYILPLAGDDYSYNYSELTGSSGQVGLMTLFILICVYCYIMLDERKADAETIGLRNILLLATAIQLFAPLNPVVSRLNYYFILFIPLALARVNTRCYDKLLVVQRLSRIVLPTFFLAYFFLAKADSLNVFNYSFFF